MANRVAVMALAAAVVIGLCLVSQRQWRWASGITIAVIWSIINFSLIVRILEVAILKDKKTDLGRILMIKFPVLYLGGFWLLTSKVFPPLSMAAGMTLTFISIGIVNIWPKRT